MDWDMYTYVIRGSIRKEVFLALKNPKTPSQIAKEKEISLSHISRALSELGNKGLVECKTPNQKIGRIYALTKKGKSILQELKKIE